MSNEEFKASTLAMIRNNSAEIERLIDKSLNCGAIDVTHQDPQDYTTRKALLNVIFSHLADQWKPLTKDGLSEVKNLECFI